MSPSFELRRADQVQRRVPPALIVEDLDVIEQFHLGLPMAVEALAELALDGAALWAVRELRS
jgi:hypothetical protein